MVYNPFNETQNEYYSYKEDDTHPDYDYYDKLNYTNDSDVNMIDLLDYNLTMHNSTNSYELTTNYNDFTNTTEIFDNSTTPDLNYTSFSLYPDDYFTTENSSRVNITEGTTSKPVTGTEATNFWTGKSLVRCYERVCETVESPLEMKKKLGNFIVTDYFFPNTIFGFIVFTYLIQIKRPTNWI